MKPNDVKKAIEILRSYHDHDADRIIPKPHYEDKICLGDGVYAYDNGYQIVITYDNNKIAMEDMVVKNFLRYIALKMDVRVTVKKELKRNAAPKE